MNNSFKERVGKGKERSEAVSGKRREMTAFLNVSGSKTCHPKMSLWHVDYFELKTIKAQKTQEEMLTFPLTA